MLARAARSSTGGCRSTRARAWPREAFALHRALRHARSRAGSPSRPRTSRRCSCAPSRRSPTCATARTRTSAPPSTRRSATRRHVLSMVAPARTARSCRSTTCSTSTPAALLVREFELPACVIVKHNNPCGVAVGGDGARGLRTRASRATRCQRVRRHHRASTGRVDRGVRRGARRSSSSRC